MLTAATRTITPIADPGLGPALGEALPDRLHVVRHRDRRQGDHDHVVDQDRPAGDEADQLVEGVARHRRRAAALAEHRPALDVGQRRQHEQRGRRRGRSAASAPARARRRARARSRSRSRPPRRRSRRASGTPSQRRITASSRDPRRQVVAPAAERHEEDPEDDAGRERPAAVGEGDDHDRRAEAEDDRREQPGDAAVDLVWAGGHRRDSRLGAPVDGTDRSVPARRPAGLACAALVRLRRDDHPAGARREHGSGSPACTAAAPLR